MQRRKTRLSKLRLLPLPPLLLALSGCAGPAAPSPTTQPVGGLAATRQSTAAASSRPAPASAYPIQIPGVGNFAQIAPGLYRGSQPTAEGFAELKKRGIKTIVNLRWIHSDRALLRGTGLRYVHIPALPWAPGDPAAAAFLKVVQDPDNYPVFVHCQHGSDRTGYLVAVYRVMEQGWAMDDAVRELRSFGYHPVWFQVVTYLRHFQAEGLRALLKKSHGPKAEVIS